MIVPTWMVLTGMDDRPVYAKATDVGIIEETPEGSRLLVQGQWAYVTESPTLLMEAVQTAGEWGTEAGLRLVKMIVEEMAGADEDAPAVN